MRCALVSDILLMDGYPTSYMSFKTRLARWIRGDWQILDWLKAKVKNKEGIIIKNPLNKLSKYKIFDNSLRSLTEISTIVAIIILILIDKFINIKIWPIVTILLISNIMESVLDVINKIILKKDGEKKQNTFTKSYVGFKASCIKGILKLACLPDKAWFSIVSIIKAVYRKNFSKKNLLEWTTSEDAEKIAKKDVFSYYKSMGLCVIAGITGLFILFMYEPKICSLFVLTLSILWIIAPIIMCSLSKENKIINKFDSLNETDKKYVLDIAKRTWQFFKDNINEESNFLPPDNYQENRKEVIALRSSPTNIGLRNVSCNISL